MMVPEVELEPEDGDGDEPEPPRRRKLSKAEAEARVVALKRPASQDALAQRWGVTSAAISQWVSEWEERVS